MLNIIFEDDTLLVLSKPAGQTVNRAQTTRGKVTTQDELEKHFGIESPREGIGGRAGIVHRLDKETSGILLVAKTKDAFERLQSQFKRRTVGKEYLALVHGETPVEGTVEAPIARNPKARTRFAVVAGGKPASTSYKRRGVYRRGGERYSLVNLLPKTGRTHQLRVHMKHTGYPIVSDLLYLSRGRFKEDLKFCPRLFLHAAALSFIHPVSGAKMRIEAELAEDLADVLSEITPV
ncbi:RluA family pseudouridine synthase [Candidatus Saccharibacteria bacterium]|nr:RluA family pseudouridine synthase [Candidatus Saccharibacteria bacterium]